MDTCVLDLPYGRSRLGVKIPAANLQTVLLPRANTQPRVADQLLRESLEHPIGTTRLRNLARPDQSVVIVTSDLTRPCPSARLIPLILDELRGAGIAYKQVAIVIALGLHRAMTELELESTVGTEIYRQVWTMNHDPMAASRLGVTSFGTPVEIFRPVVEADLRICVGNIEPHYFAGYSGGAKAILAGCASRATISANHALMVQPNAVAGELEKNPLRADIEEGASMLGIDFILNVLVDDDHRIAGAVSGEVKAAHRHGCQMAAQRSQVPIAQRGDIVVVSSGGYPKDVNLYQAQKALDNAARAVREGGIVILVAECSEGFGNDTFETWIRQSQSPHEVLDWIRRRFVLGGHKAAAIARVLEWSRVYLVSELPVDQVQWRDFVLFEDVDEAFRHAVRELGSEASVIVMPSGGSTLPVVIES